MVRKGYKKAIVALAHKMLRIIYAMLSNGTHYKDSTVDYEALTVATECAALAEDAAQARIYYRRRYGVTGQTRGRTDSVLVWS